MGSSPPGTALLAAIVVAVAMVTVAVAPRDAAADRVVRGVVVDAAGGAPIEGALVLVGDGEDTTGADGRFRIGGLGPARVDVTVLADGYGAFFGAARPGAELTIRLAVERGTSELIRLNARAPTGPPLALDAEAIRTQPGAGNDVLRALQSLPGVARTPFGLGGLALRGSAPRDTKVYLDGIEVPLLYHFGGLASFLPTAAVADVALEPGGAGARYGRGLGGVALVTSRTGRRDRWQATGELSLLHAAAVGEGPGPLAGSWLVGFRRSYFDGLIAAADVELAVVPRYMDAQLRWESGDGHWMAIVVGSDDSLSLVPGDEMEGGIDTSNVKSFSYRARFARLGVRYRAVHGTTSFTITPSLGVDDLDANVNHKNVDKGMHRTTVPVSLRAELSLAAFAGTLTAGLDAGWQRHAYDLLNTPPATPQDPSPSMVIPRSLSRWSGDAGAYLEQSWFLADDRVELRAGLRGDHVGLSDEWSLDPRLVASVRVGDATTISQSLGRYHAPPLVTDLDPIFGDRVMPGSKALQAATTIKRTIGDDREVSAAVYYQDLDQLPVDALSAATPISANGGTESGGVLGISRELVDTQFGSYTYREAIGYGHAYGVELLARKSRGRWTGWAAYTYARSFRVNPARDDVSRPYVLDQPHALTVVASTALGRRWRFGGRLRYTTGNPFTPVGGAFVEPDGDWSPVDGELLSRRLPDFVQLDLRVDRAWKRRWGTVALYIDLQNVTNRANPEGVTYNEDYTRQQYTTGLPIFPSIGVEYLP
jgi:hypothetical protein